MGASYSILQHVSYAPYGPLNGLLKAKIVNRMPRLTFTAATAVKAMRVDKKRGCLLCHEQKLGGWKLAGEFD